jgi:translocating chain-associated membrane protein 1
LLYVLKKILPKARLSKTKEKKFNESGQLLGFYAVSALWALSIFRDVNNQNIY